jgi:cyclopropane-fatty-acyl-phospholipid synthase
MSDQLSAGFPDACASQDRGRGLKRLADAALLKMLVAALASTSSGRLRLTLPSGRSALLGRGGGIEANLALNNYGVVWRSMRRGLIGFAESYLAEDFDTDSLHDLFSFYLDNEAAISAALPGLLRGARHDLEFHSSRRNTRVGSRRNIAAHYDLGNEFYRLWLDPSMSYSSGIYTRPDMSLEAAQDLKCLRILEALDIDPAHDVLEIGCGWGALAEAMVARGARVTAITISEQQHKAASKRLAGVPLADRAAVLFQDYRDTTGRFDRIVSIEMIEAVGEDNWPTYFRTIHDRLKPGGQAVIQAITIHEDLFEDYRNKPDFIQRYIFPGGMLPSVPMMRENAEATGLDFSEIERFGGSYALTVAEWRKRFLEAWPRIQALGFDERFRRMWDYYLTYCEVGFQRGTIDVGLYRLQKPQAQ